VSRQLRLADSVEGGSRAAPGEVGWDPWWRMSDQESMLGKKKGSMPSKTEGAK
jgi:hypothetical protein